MTQTNLTVSIEGTVRLRKAAVPVSIQGVHIVYHKGRTHTATRRRTEAWQSRHHDEQAFMERRMIRDRRSAGPIRRIK
jgi:hypothetical protein